MNYIKHLTGFFDRIVQDDQLNPTHISLYIALFQYWNVNRFQNPISISRSEIMRISKISAKATYHKCMNDLHRSGYITYQPSYNPFKGSLVFITELDTPLLQEGSARQSRAGGGGSTRRQLVNKHQSGTEQALVPSSNNSNIKNERANAPTQLEVENYFKEKKYSPDESKKFFNHYKAIGWKIQGITPIEDWKALAEKWMQNAQRWGAQVATPASEAPLLNELYQAFLLGKNIFNRISIDHFKQLNLKPTHEHFQKAREQRINQVSGTNQHSLNQLWAAYLNGDENNQLIKEDRRNLEALAKRIAVIDHFQSLKKSGNTECKQ